MIAMTVDDERPMLAALTAAVSASPDISSVMEFTTCSSALEWAENNTVDVAFLDISMRGMGGLKLAEKIVELHPDCRIIFCTGYTQYALDAIQLHVSGYLLKPITAKAVQKELESQLSTLPRQDIARQSIQTNGRIIVTDSLEKAVDAANLIAPEHLELCVEDPFALLPRVKNAGSIFLGRHAPEALGDYFAGPNHTLPTSGTARFSSPLSVDDFVKKSSFLYYTQEALAPVAERIADFARREGLEAHARSALIRTNQGGNPQ